MHSEPPTQARREVPHYVVPDDVVHLHDHPPPGTSGTEGLRPETQQQDHHTTIQSNSVMQASFSTLHCRNLYLLYMYETIGTNSTEYRKCRFPPKPRHSSVVLTLYIPLYTTLPCYPSQVWPIYRIRWLLGAYAIAQYISPQEGNKRLISRCA